MGKVPQLKTLLRSFLDLENSSREKSIAIKEMKQSGRETPPPLSLYNQEYIRLKELTESLKTDSTFPMYEGQSDVNRKKNRYKDILPCIYDCQQLFSLYVLTQFIFFDRWQKSSYTFRISWSAGLRLYQCQLCARFLWKSNSLYCISGPTTKHFGWFLANDLGNWSSRDCDGL